MEQDFRTGLWLAKEHLSAPAAAEQRQKFLETVEKNGYVIRKSIQDWNNAQNFANMTEPKNYLIQNLYDSACIDAHLTSQMQIRTEQIFSSDFSLFNPDGSVNEEQTKIVKKLEATRDIVTAILEIRSHGYTLIQQEVTRDRKINVKVLPRANVIPKKGLFYPDYDDDIKKIPYRELREFGIWIIEFDSKNLGYLNKTIPHVLFKRFAQSCWSELCEIYGIPPRTLKTDTGNPKAVARGEKMMRDMGSAAWSVIDVEETLEFAKSAATDGSVFSNLIGLCKDELSTLVNAAVMGQDTKNGNRSKEESNQDLQWLLVQSDMELVEQHWNNRVLPSWVELGIIKPGTEYRYHQAEDTAQLYKFTIGFLQYYNIDPAWIQAKFGVEVIAKEEVDPEEEKPDAGKKKPAKKETKEALSFFPEAVENAANWKTQNCCGLSAKSLPLPKTILNLESVAKRFYDAAGSLSFDIELFYYTAQILITGLKKGSRSDKAKLSINVGFEYGTDDPAMLTSFEQNLFRFSAAKTLAQAQELNRLFKSSKSFEDFYQNAKLKLEVYNKAHLETEYNTAYLTGEATATYERLKAQTKTFPYWKYVTIGDDRVRPEHRKLHDLILPANDPRWKKLYPPNGWGCRCYIVPLTAAECKNVDFAKMREIADAFFETDEFAKIKKQGFGVNRSESGEVFTQNQFYVDNLDTAGAKLLNEVTYEDYQLKPADKKQKAAKKDFPEYTNDYKTFLENTETVKDKNVLRDYNNRPAALPAKLSKKDNDLELLEAMQQTTERPDEVWINDTGSKTYDQFISIKYYAGATMIVISTVKNGQSYSIVKWLATEADADLYRTGLLIFSK